MLNLKDVDISNILSSPKEWAELVLPNPENPRLPFRANWLQADHILSPNAPGKILITAQRQAGKTCGVAARILWFATTQRNRMVLVVAPMTHQVGKVFEFLRTFINNSDFLKDSVVRNVSNPHEIVFSNESRIKGFCTGVSSKAEARSIRGQGAHFIYVDEADYISDDDWKAIIPLWVVKPGSRTSSTSAWLTSTVSGVRTKFYMMTHNVDGQGEGWKWWNFPVKYTGPHCTAYNPNWTEDDDYQAQINLTDLEYKHELLCELGDFEQGVFPNEFIDSAMERGEEYGLKYDIPSKYHAIRSFGVDWDKYAAAPNICVMEIDPADSISYNVIYREDTQKSEYTLDEAVKRVFELNKIFRPAYIYVDRGYGELQVEQLQRQLSNIKGIAYNGRTDYFDPIAMNLVKMPIKHVMVNIAQWMFEKKLIRLHKGDRSLISQLQLYRVEKVTQNKMPVYSSTNDHAVCSFMMALFALVENFNNPYIRRREYADPTSFRLNFYKDFKLSELGPSHGGRPRDPDESTRSLPGSLHTGITTGVLSPNLLRSRDQLSSFPVSRTPI